MTILLSLKMAYCGLDESCLGAVAGVGAAGGLVFMRAPGSALCESGAEELDRGANGPVTIALSGFSK